jgi:hypothetical protein
MGLNVEVGIDKVTKWSMAERRMVAGGEGLGF